MRLLVKFAFGSLLSCTFILVAQVDAQSSDTFVKIRKCCHRSAGRGYSKGICTRGDSGYLEHYRAISRGFMASLSSTGIVPTAKDVPSSSPIDGRGLWGCLVPSRVL